MTMAPRCTSTSSASAKTPFAGALLAIAGFVLMLAAAAMNSSLYAAGIMLGLLAMLFLGLQPLGATLGAGLRQPGILPNMMRTGAALGAVGSLILAWRVVQSGRVEDGMLIAGIIAFAGFIGIANALRKPGLRKPLLPVSVVIGLGLALFFARLPVLFAGVNHERYFSQMRRLANDVHVWQSQLHADSGYYAAVPDTSILPLLYRGGLLDLRPERTSDGYRAWASSRALDSRFHCAVYEGTTRAEPARRPGEVECVMYPDYPLQTLSRSWILVIVVASFWSLLVRRAQAVST